MLNFMFQILGWTSGQINCYKNFLRLIRLFVSGGVHFKQLFSFFLSLVQLFCAAAFKTPITPMGEELDLSGYELVFCDEFTGDELDYDVWLDRGVGTRRGGFNAASQSKVENGNLILTGEYLEDGEYGAGWYTGAVALYKNYTRGYFEINCKINEGASFWSAFWLQAVTDPYDHYNSNGGINAVELDIMESQCPKAFSITNITDKGIVTSNIHCNGYDDDIDNIDSQRVGEFYVDDMYDEYHTYGMLWTEDEYIFYIDGIETLRSTWANGVCISPEQVIVSLEIPEEFDDSIANNKNYKTQMTVDYVKIYQLPADITE